MAESLGLFINTATTTIAIANAIAIATVVRISLNTSPLKRRTKTHKRHRQLLVTQAHIP
jgi:hypothetical protein